MDSTDIIHYCTLPRGRRGSLRRASSMCNTLLNCALYVLLHTYCCVLCMCVTLCHVCYCMYGEATNCGIVHGHNFPTSVCVQYIQMCLSMESVCAVCLYKMCVLMKSVCAVCVCTNVCVYGELVCRMYVRMCVSVCVCSNVNPTCAIGNCNIQIL